MMIFYLGKRLLDKAVEAKTSFDDSDEDDHDHEEFEVAIERGKRVCSDKHIVRDYVNENSLLDVAIKLSQDYGSLMTTLYRFEIKIVNTAVRMILEQYYLEHTEIKERLETRFKSLMLEEDYEAMLYESFVTEIIGASYLHCTSFKVSPTEEIIVFNTITDALSKRPKPVMTVSGPAEITVVHEIVPFPRYSFTTEDGVSIKLSNTKYYIKPHATRIMTPLARYEVSLDAHDSIVVVR